MCCVPSKDRERTAASSHVVKDGVKKANCLIGIDPVRISGSIGSP